MIIGFRQVGVFIPEGLPVDLGDGHGALVEGRIVDLRPQALALGFILGVLAVIHGLEEIVRQELPIHEIQVAFQIVALPAQQVIVIIGAPVHGHGQRFGGALLVWIAEAEIEIHRQHAVCKTGLFQVDRAALDLPQDQKGRDIVRVGAKIGLQRSRRLAHHHLGDIIPVAEGVIEHEHRMHPARPAIQRLCQVVDAHIALPILPGNIADAPGYRHAIAPTHKGVGEVPTGNPQLVVDIRVAVLGRVFEDHRHIHAVLFFDIHAHQRPVVVVHLDNAHGVYTLGGVAIYRTVRAAIGDHLHPPAQAHFLVAAPIDDAAAVGRLHRPVEHISREGHRAAPVAVADLGQRHVGHQVAGGGIHILDDNPVGIQLGAVQPVFDRHAQLAILAYQRRGDGQVGVVTIRIGHGDLEHRHQADIAVIGAGFRILDRGVGRAGPGSGQDTLDLAQRIVRRPVHHIAEPVQVARVGGAQLELHKDRVIRLQVVHAELERVGAVKGLADLVVKDGGRNIHIVQHTVVVVIVIENIRRAVAVAVGADGARVGAGREQRPGVALHAIGEAIPVGVVLVGVEIPLQAVVSEALHFQRIGDRVAVRVRQAGQDAQPVDLHAIV